MTSTTPPRISLVVFSYGGLEPATTDSLIYELVQGIQNRIEMTYARAHGDALISRSRSVALTEFLNQPNADVLFMLDHDISWNRGELIETCFKAHERRSMVSGLYSLRREHVGHAGRLPRGTDLYIGKDELYSATYLPTGFLAIPKVVAMEVKQHGESENPEQKLTECKYLDGRPFTDFFRPLVVNGEYLSEDYSFCHRARLANDRRPQYLWGKPHLLHWGMKGYSMRESAVQSGTSLITKV